MKRLFTLLVLCGIFAAGALAQRPEALINKASVDPVIDGVIDEVWAEAAAENNIDRPTLRDALPTNPSLGELGETTWQGLWTYTGIYVLLRVNDDDFHPYYEVPGTNSWEYDKPELYFDVNYLLEDDGGPSTGNGHYQVAPAFADGLNDGTKLTEGFNGVPGDYIEYAFMVDDPSYIAEYFIPFSELMDQDGIVVDLEGEIGFDVTILDRDEGDDNYSGAVWSNIGTIDGSWVNMNESGIITLDGAGGGTYVDEINLQGGEISENNGTLQILAEVLPEDASNPTINWTVENGTGKASIDKNGIVTGIMDGDVTVMAEAADGSYISATTVVTISNQIVSLGEINLFRNGNFDKVDEAGSPLEWDGGFTVVEGALYIPAPDSTRNWWEGGARSSQTGFGLNTTDEYTFSFVMWSESPDTFYIDFEDPANGYNRFGDSSSPLAAGLSDGSADGSSQWEFVTNVDPTYYLIDEALVFTRWMENTQEGFNLMGGKHEEGGIFVDSLILINNNDKAMLTPGYMPVTEIVVSGGSAVDVGGTLQFDAAVTPGDATLTEVRWSVMNGTGYATIDAAGLLTGDTAGMVTVIATAKDDSGVTGVMDVSVGGVGIDQKSVETLKVYPNPAVNELNVVLSSENSTVSIYNGVGQKMEQVVVSGKEYRFDISSYAAGIYFVRTEQSVAKFVK